MATSKGLQFLHPDIKKEIMMHLDIDSLPSLATTCRDFYDVYRKNKGAIHYGITANTVGPHLPFAVLSHAALLLHMKEDWHFLDWEESLFEVIYFCREHMDPDTLGETIKEEDFHYNTAVAIIDEHDLLPTFMANNLGMVPAQGNKYSVKELFLGHLDYYKMHIVTSLTPPNSHHDIHDAHKSVIWHYLRLFLISLGLFWRPY